MNQDELKTICTEIGKKYGYEQVEAEFEAFRDFKVKWTRSATWIQFHISDYMQEAPEDLVRDLVDLLFRKIKGQDGRYSEAFLEYMTSQEFIDLNQETYLRRYIGLTEESDYHDLEEAYMDLIADGLVEYDPNVVIRWHGAKCRSVGSSSVLMHTVVLNKQLDVEGISTHAFEYVLYRQLMTIAMGYNPGSNKSEELIAKLDMYPDREEAERELRAIGFKL